MRFSYMTEDVCSREISFNVEGDVITDIEFRGGCDGNLRAIAKLVDGWTVEQIESKLLGVPCASNPTSCADQLARAVRAAYKKTKE